MSRGLLGSSGGGAGAVDGTTLLSDEPLPSFGGSVAMGTGWSSLLPDGASPGTLERTSSDPPLAVAATGWEVDTTGGWEVTKDSEGVTVVPADPLALVDIPVEGVVPLPIVLFIILSSTCNVT